MQRMVTLMLLDMVNREEYIFQTIDQMMDQKNLR